MKRAKLCREVPDGRSRFTQSLYKTCLALHSATPCRGVPLVELHVQHPQTGRWVCGYGRGCLTADEAREAVERGAAPHGYVAEHLHTATPNLLSCRWILS